MRALAIAIVFFALVPALLGEAASTAEWKVRGMGYFKNRSLQKQLDLILNQSLATFNASDIEDAALVLISYLEDEGFLSAKAVALIDDGSGEPLTVTWDRNFDVYLPRELEAKSVRFELEKGPRFYFRDLKIEGSAGIDNEAVSEFFFSKPLALQSERSRRFTSSLLSSGGNQLVAHLKSLGYQAAAAKTGVSEMDNETGAVDAWVAVEAGPMHSLEKVTVSVEGPGPRFEIDTENFMDLPFSRFVSQDIAKELRNRYFAAGYPEVSIRSSAVASPGENEEKTVELQIDVETGSKARIASIEYAGSKNTKPSLIQSRLAVSEGDPLNPVLLDRSRLRLSRLGVFDRVDYTTEAIDEEAHAVRFELQERTTWNVETFLGWGSYEQARGGLTVEKINLFGRGHRARIKTALSMKSALGELRYSVPEIFGTPANASAKVFALEREEIAFDRRDFGVDLGVARTFDRLGLEVDTIYSLKKLELEENELADELEEQSDARVGSVELRIGRDRRDSALNPKSGYRLFSQMELATESLGGEVDFQSIDLGASFHGDFSRGLYWHVGLSHGAIGTLWDSESQIPASVPFFPGGENTMRGYQRSEAAPKDAEGKFIGARSYTLANLELEQSLSESVSLVAFIDALGTASRIEEYPFDDHLVSAGIGIRFKTFMGPIRLEYGHNLNPRPLDPDGTLHFALGFPF